MATTAQQARAVQQMYLTHSHKNIAAAVGLSVNVVRNLCHERGWIKRDDYWTDADIAKLIEWYMRPGGSGKDTLKLATLAEEMGRCKANVCRKARSLGLTSLRRRVMLEDTKSRLSAQAKQAIAKHGHPRGALGMKHTPETLAVLSEKSKACWKRQKEKPLLLAASKAKMVRTRIERYGTASPVHLINNGQSVYSRCRRGVREDLGFFVRSRWEANYARYLKWLQANGHIASWEYEPEVFRFHGVGRGPYTYKPDFSVTDNAGTVVYHEVKGWMDSASKGKIKRFQKFYPQHTLAVIDAKAYREIERKMSTIIPHWEP